jgi:hypothetical protein
MKKILTICVTIAIVVLSTQAFAVEFSSAPNKLSAYYIAPAQSIAEIKTKLTHNGFKILATTNILNGHDVLTITNAELQTTNTYMAAINVSISTKDVRVQNPSYLGAAYLGDTYRYGQFKSTVNALEKALGTLKESAQKTDFSDLKEYRFMFGMPKFIDTIKVKNGSGLVNRVKNSAYTLRLPNGLILVGHKLKIKTNKFLQTLGQEKNAQLLPYQSMIFQNRAVMLDPKYYLALQLPLLTMGEFMEIASIPDQIEKEIKKAYK